MYDYIISGSGCAGLSLLVNMIRSGAFADSKILLVDKGPKTANDRTWCFWELGEGPFEPVVYRHWEKLWFHGPGYSALKDIRPYRYKMIRGLDFYDYCFDLIGKQRNITVLYGNIEGLHSNEKETFVVVDGVKIPGVLLFNSIPGPLPKIAGRHYLLQHFMGWIIRTHGERFSAAEATLMDFRVGQENGTTFVYTMPFSPSTALVEYTSFSERVPDRHVYEEGLKNYLQERLHLSIGEYTVLEEEVGVIPMTNHPFAGRDHNIFHIGTAGGRTKPSSGYTFQFIQKQSRVITASLTRTGKPATFPKISKGPRRYGFYDSVLLNVLATGKGKGDRIFTDLFSRNSIKDIFSFLDNDSNLPQDLRIIRSLPVLPFLKAACQEIVY